MTLKAAVCNHWFKPVIIIIHCKKKNQYTPYSLCWEHQLLLLINAQPIAPAQLGVLLESNAHYPQQHSYNSSTGNTGLIQQICAAHGSCTEALKAMRLNPSAGITGPCMLSFEQI